MNNISGIMNINDETKHVLQEHFFMNKMDLSKKDYHKVLRGGSNSVIISIQTKKIYFKFIPFNYIVLNIKNFLILMSV